jgi:hypothetical protein
MVKWNWCLIEHLELLRVTQELVSEKTMTGKRAQKIDDI